MTPRRIDRQAVHARLDHMTGWIIETLLDAFEPAALKAAGVAEKRREKIERGARRAHVEDDSEDD